MMQELNKVSQLQIGKDIRVKFQTSPSPNVDSTTPRRGYENNLHTRTKAYGHSLGFKMGLNLTGFFHTHPEVKDRNATLYPSPQDLDTKNKGILSKPELNYYLITRPENYGQSYPRKLNYTKY